MFASAEFLALFVLLGTFVGFVAGLLGVGGGGIMVPIMTSLFLLQGEVDNTAVHLALGTSMAAIVATSFSSMLAHHRHHNVDWAIVRRITPGILFGTYIGTLLVSMLNALVLASFFAFFMFLVAVQMMLGRQPESGRRLPGPSILAATGAGIGGVSALVSIGGGSMSVPFLYWHNVPLKTAVGTSAAIGFPIAITGTLGYIINGSNLVTNSDGTLGFIFVPGVIAVSIASALTAPLGVKLAHRLPVATIRKLFSILLIGLSIKMLVSIVR